MPTLVHLANEREAASIRRSGIKTGKKQKWNLLHAHYAKLLPVAPMVKRIETLGGVKTFVGVYFKVDSKTKVFAGTYKATHKHSELGKTIKQLQTMEDPIGNEIIPEPSGDLPSKPQ